jgi:hypothetical protein
MLGDLIVQYIVLCNNLYNLDLYTENGNLYQINHLWVYRFRTSPQNIQDRPAEPKSNSRIHGIPYQFHLTVATTNVPFWSSPSIQSAGQFPDPMATVLASKTSVFFWNFPLSMWRVTRVFKILFVRCNFWAFHHCNYIPRAVCVALGFIPPAYKTSCSAITLNHNSI